MVCPYPPFSLITAPFLCCAVQERVQTLESRFSTAYNRRETIHSQEAMWPRQRSTEFGEDSKCGDWL